MSPKEYMRSVRRAAGYIRARAPKVVPKVAVILGSGLAKAIPGMDRPAAIPYDDIPGFPKATVTGHVSRMLVGAPEGARKDAGGGRLQGMAVLQGRFHYYEGHPVESLVLPLRALRDLGLETVVITSAVGSMRPNIRPGDIVALTDHINFLGANPLRGFHTKECGEMFPSLTDAYDPALRSMAMGVCRSRRIPAHEGVYVAAPGPSYETPAEIRAYRLLGGHVVGMSVVPEVIAARQIGVRVLALSWIANMASGMPGATLSHMDVLAMGEKVSGRLQVLLGDIVGRLFGAATGS